MTKEWEELLRKLSSTHTYNIHKLCECLKCSRRWIYDYVIPNLQEDDILHLSNGYQTDHSKKSTKSYYDDVSWDLMKEHLDKKKSRSVPWTWIAQQQLRKMHNDSSIELKDLVWFSEDAFKNLIYKNSTATQQVKRVPLSYFIEPAKLRTFVDAYNEYDKEIAYVESYNAFKEMKRAQNRLFKEALSKDGANLLAAGERFVHKRGEIDKLLEVEVPKIPFEKWLAPHDMKRYGDTDEATHRLLFSKGLIRIEVKLANEEKGTESSKVFYVEDQNPLPNPYNLPSKLIEASIWEEHKLTGKK